MVGVLVAVIGGVLSQNHETANSALQPVETHQVPSRSESQQLLNTLRTRQAYIAPLSSVVAALAGPQSERVAEHLQRAAVAPLTPLAPSEDEMAAEALVAAEAAEAAEAAVAAEPVEAGETAVASEAPASSQSEDSAAAAPDPEAGLLEGAGPPIHGVATHYGYSFNGLPLGCGNGLYSSDDPTIVAVSPARYQQWPCGTRLQVCGPADCMVVTRQDSCPGCHANMFDLSEAGSTRVCGGRPHTCEVTVRELAP